MTTSVSKDTIEWATIPIDKLSTILALVMFKHGIKEVTITEEDIHRFAPTPQTPFTMQQIVIHETPTAMKVMLMPLEQALTFKDMLETPVDKAVPN